MERLLKTDRQQVLGHKVCQMNSYIDPLTTYFFELF